MSELSTPQNRRILIIDDNRSIHEDFAKILGPPRRNRGGLDDFESELFGDSRNVRSAAEFELSSAYQGREGLEMVKVAVSKVSPFAMAFVDVRMPPGWDGIETVEKIWQVDPEVQIVICTAYSDYSWDEMFRKLGHSDRLLILKKPFDNVEVLQMAAALVEKWRLARQASARLDDLERVVSERTADLQITLQQLRESILEQKTAERNRQMMEVQLRQAHKLESIGRLASSIAHEINTPTQFIGDNLRFVQESTAELFHLLDRNSSSEPTPLNGAASQATAPALGTDHPHPDLQYLKDEIPKALQQSLEGVERVVKIVSAMKHFSHPGTDAKSPLDLNLAIERTLIVAQGEWRTLADTVTDFDPSLPPVPCLAGEFNQVILNIVVNAAHAIAEQPVVATSGKGVITIRTRLDGAWAEIRIGDTGAGIPESVRGRIFEPFFTTKGIGRGTGQGLALAHSVIVTQHGGTLTFESEVGKGTTFIIRLPISPA